MYFSEVAGEIPAGDYPVATEEELLEFANKMRKAGAAEPLEALIPSEPSNPKACLIANALNFSCTVAGSTNGDHLRSKYGFRYVWAMYLPPNTGKEQVKALSEATGVPIESFGDIAAGLSPILSPLPAHIGNAADAFDEGKAFQEFVVSEDYPYDEDID
jgi:hypothetical protein